MGKTQDTKHFEHIDGVKIFRYQQPWQGRGVLGYLCEYGWAMMWSFLLLVWIWIKYGFDVLHAANPPDLFCFVAAPFLLLRKRFVFDQHDLCPELLEAKIGPTSILKKMMLIAEHCSYKLADLVVVTNESAYDIASQRGARSEKICIVRNGPDLDHFVGVPADPRLKGDAQHLALYIGAMAVQDGVDRVVRAVHHIVHERGRKDVKFAILGDGDCLSDLQRLAHSLEVEPYIDFAGWVDDTHLFSYLSTADVCLAPDPPIQSNQISTFIKIMEYMCYGKVTVSFDLTESRRTAGPTGIYVEKDDPALFGDSILNILDSPELRERLGEAAAERIRTCLHWGMSSSALLEGYERVIWNRLRLCADSVDPSKHIASTQKGDAAGIDEA